MLPTPAAVQRLPRQGGGRSCEAEVVEFYHRLIRNSDAKLDTGAEDEGSGEKSGSGEEIYGGEDYELISDLE